LINLIIGQQAMTSSDICQI